MSDGRLLAGELQLAIVVELSNQQGLVSTELYERIGASSPSSIRRALRKMRAAGVLERDRFGRHSLLGEPQAPRP